MSTLDPDQMLTTLPESIPRQVPDGFPPVSVAEAVLAGVEDRDGAYLVLVKWCPGRMSAPHTYARDWLCVVVSGVWWRSRCCGACRTVHPSRPRGSCGLAPCGRRVIRSQPADVEDGLAAAGYPVAVRLG
jgi:hypothetical protein